MNKILAFLITILLALPAMAAELSVAPREPAAFDQFPAADRPAFGASVGQPYAKVAALSQEDRLGQALELHPSDLFALNEPVGAVEELELMLPEVELPDSDIPLTLNNKVEYFVNYSG